MGDPTLSQVAVALGLPADAAPREVLARAVDAGRALHLLPEAGAQPAPRGGRGDVLLDLASGLGDEQSRLRALLLARRAVGVGRYGQPLRYESRVEWGRELLHELADASGYAQGYGWRPMAQRLLGHTWRVLVRRDRERAP